MPKTTLKKTNDNYRTEDHETVDLNQFFPAGYAAILQSLDARILPGGGLLVPRRRLKARHDQPRKTFDEVQDRATSIKNFREQGRGIGGTGILQALSVSWPPNAFNKDGTLRDPDHVQLLIDRGETRYRATREIKGFTDDDFLPVIIGNESEDESYENAGHENFQRKNLTMEEEADWLLRIRASLAKRYNITNPKAHKLSAASLGQYVGMSKDWVQVRLDLKKIDIDEDVQAILMADPESGSIVQRIKRIKEPPEFRAWLIGAAIAGAGDSALRKFIQIRDVAFRQEVARRAGEGASFVELQRYLNEYISRKAIPPTSNGNNGSYSKASDTPTSAFRYGGAPDKGVTVVPKSNVGVALDMANQQLDRALDTVKSFTTQGGKFPVKEKREWREKLAHLFALANDLESNL